MTQICPKCRYVRQATDICPDWQCPSCQVAYLKAGGADYLPASTANRSGTRTEGRSAASWLKWLIVALVLLGIAWQSQLTRTKQISAASTAGQAGQTSQQPLIVLYGTSWCGYCAAAREFFKANGIQFKDLDIESSTEGYEGHKKLGGGGVPVITIGNEVMQGYNEASLRQTLGPWLKAR